MKFDILTLAVIESLTILTQLIALFVQYFVNRTSRGIIWWLLGSTFWAIGVILMPTVSIKSIEILARVANPLVILGEIFLLIGVIRFLNRKENRWVLTCTYLVFLIFYYYFMFGYNDISSRTLVFCIVVVVISFMATYELFFHKDRNISGSANYTATIFFAYMCFYIIRVCFVVTSPRIESYFDPGELVELSFIVPTIVTLLWTFGFIIMLNQRLNAENREEKEKMQLVFNTSPDAALISKLKDGTIVDVNAGFLNMTGYHKDEVVEKSTIQTNIWHQINDRDQFLEELKNKGICENKEYIFQRKDGSLLTGSISAKIIPIHGEEHIVSFVHDITERKQAEVIIRESEELYRSILNASPDDITITDLKGNIVMISPVAKRLFGYEPDYDLFIGTQLVDYIQPEEKARAKLNIEHLIKGEKIGPNEYHGVRKDGSLFNIEVNSGLIFGLDNTPVKMVFVIRDISERKRTEQQIQQLVYQLEIEKKTAQLNANTDSLTGLANRRYFDEALNTEFRRAKRSGAALSLIMLDIDHFKEFNDSYGHLAGDECLRDIGDTLKKIIGRATDIVARFGGDEFVAILTDTDQNGAVILAERFRKTVEELDIPNIDSDITKWITVSLGVVAVYPSKLESPEEIISMADDALYQAKKCGRNRVFIYSEN